MKTLLTLAFVALVTSAFAQSNFYKLSLGAGGGLTTSFGDLQEHNSGLAFYGTADYLFSPFFSIGLEVQEGNIKGGQFRIDKYNRQFKNDFRSLGANIRLQLGILADYNHNKWLNYAKGLYLGVGVGAIQNRLRELERRIPGAPEAVYVPRSMDLFIPLNVGYNYYIPDKKGYFRYVLNLNYQINYIIGEGMDGYDSSVITTIETKPDVFSFFTLGLKYNFGPMGVSQKTFLRY